MIRELTDEDLEAVVGGKARPRAAATPAADRPVIYHQPVVRGPSAAPPVFRRPGSGSGGGGGGCPGGVCPA